MSQTDTTQQAHVSIHEGDTFRDELNNEPVEVLDIEGDVATVRSGDTEWRERVRDLREKVVAGDYTPTGDGISISVDSKATPEGVPEDYEYIAPDEEPPEDHDVVESDRGATYVSPEPTDGTNDNGLSPEVQEAIDEVDALADRMKQGEGGDLNAKFEMQTVIEEQTGVGSVEFRTQEVDKSARCGKELLRLSDSEDLSGLDQFRVDSTDDDLKGLRGVASGRYKIRESKIVINPDQFEEAVVQEWEEDGHWAGSEPESTIKHEVAHHLHAENTAPLDRDADVDWETIKEEFDETTEERVDEVISEYGATMIGEFIAEAYVFQKEGGTLPEDLTDLYAQYNGPEVA